MGVITSAEGAAVQDIITGMRRHNDLIPLVIYPATVQGATAVEALLYALRCAIVEGRCDVLIIARGGGASETLAVFNDERLLRAVAASPVPVISAVGHDVDQTLLDEVADIRAATPTAACQYCCASKQEVREVCARLQGRMQLAIRDRLNGARQQYAALQQAQGFNLDKLRGKTATEYTYHITNYPEKDNVVAHILVYKDKIVAADLSDMEQGGFCDAVISG